MQSSNPKDKVGQTKPPLHLIPPAASIEEAMAMGLGAKKYGPYNWRAQSVLASVYVAACKRHIDSWFDGENIDPESAASHLAHARACLGILLDARACGTLIDDRPSPGRAAQLIKEFTRNQTQTQNPARNCEPVPDEVPRVYIAGPMRGLPEFNFPSFDAARDRFLAAGWDVVSPADLDRAAPSKATSDEEASQEAFIHQYIDRDLSDTLLTFRASRGDAIAMLPGWEASTGASAEFMVARWAKLPVLDAISQGRLKNWDAGQLARSVSDFLHFANP